MGACLSTSSYTRTQRTTEFKILSYSKRANTPTKNMTYEEQLEYHRTQISIKQKIQPSISPIFKYTPSLPKKQKFSNSKKRNWSFSKCQHFLICGYIREMSRLISITIACINPQFILEFCLSYLGYNPETGKFNFLISEQNAILYSDSVSFLVYRVLKMRFDTYINDENICCFFYMDLLFDESRENISNFQSFHRICDNQKNLLFLFTFDCDIEREQIFGVFTSVVWGDGNSNLKKKKLKSVKLDVDRNGNYGYFDKFLFAFDLYMNGNALVLDINHDFNERMPSNVYFSLKNGPIFGGYDIQIVQKTDLDVENNCVIKYKMIQFSKIFAEQYMKQRSYKIKNFSVFKIRGLGDF